MVIIKIGRQKGKTKKERKPPESPAPTKPMSEPCHIQNCFSAQDQCLPQFADVVPPPDDAFVVEVGVGLAVDLTELDSSTATQT